MAKPRKPKSSDGAAATAPAASKPENSGAVVRHQKLCLSIDLARRQIYGYTELEIAVPDIGIAGLYAENLGIESVFVDGEPTEFEYYPRQHHSSEDSEKRWSSLVTNPSSAADAAGAVYTSALERELVPNLLINCCKAAFRVANEQQDQVQENLGSNGVGDVRVNLESNGVEPSAGEGKKQSNGIEPASREGTNLSNGVEPTAGEGMNQSNGVEPSAGEGVNQSIGVEPSAGVETKQNVKVVRVNYWVEKAETGIHFDDNVVHTDNQIRRARCWFPCIDEGFQRCCYDLEFTVPHNLVAVSTGSLLYQVLRKDDPPSKTYVYRLDVPVTAQWISLVVAPFEILPDPHVGLISHMCLPANSSKLRNAVEFFHYAFNYYEEYLDAKFPFGSYTQVFLDPDMAVSSSSLGASVGIFSSQVLYDEKVIDQTIDTSIKLALALAKQWFGAYIAPEGPNDEWLMDGLAGFLTDLYIKKFLGNNEARYRRFKANCAICKADDGGATTLSSTASCKDLYGTHRIGLYGKIRSWKSVAILQMLEKQMGPESFRKILQKVVSRARDVVPLRTLSTKEFRHFTTKVGNLERPFVKEFFSRWVCSCGCPVLRMGFSYNKKKNMVELAVLRECTATPDASASVINPDSENRDGEIGWPGMMSIRVYELDGMYDHPVLPLAGDMWQLLEIQCHSKLAARRFQKAKKGSKPDGSDENGDVPAADMRSSLESPLLWIRADPEMEYLAQLHFNQPVQMWINQLEKDGDVIAQAQAITALEALPQLSFSVVNALNNFLCDSKGFWRVRIEAAFALANSASEDTDWAGLLHLVKFYKSRRFDATIGLPKPNDFHDFPEYFVLEAIPHAVAMVRATDKKSPREAVEFVLQLLKHNDNTGNPYSDVFWLAALVQSVGELEFGQQSLVFLSSLLKRIDRLLQFDRLMPSYNGILTVSCIRTLVQIALKLSGSLHLDHVSELIKPFWNLNTVWQIRIEAGRALLDLESHCRGIDAALSLFIRCLGEEPSLRGQAKLGAHALHLCQMLDGCHSNNDIKSSTLLALLHLIEGHTGFNNIFLRHHLFCILQILAGRAPTLYGVPREKASRIGDAETGMEQKNFFTALIMETRPAESRGDIPKVAEDSLAIPEVFKETDTVSNNQQPIIDLTIPELPREAHAVSNDHDVVDLTIPEGPKEANIISHIDDQMILAVPDAPKDPDTVSNGHEYRKPVVKIRVKRSAASSRAEDADNQTVGRSQGRHSGIDRGASSSISVDAPHRISAEAASISNHNVEEVNSYLDHGSRMTASIGSAKFVGDGDNFGKELQCTAESSKISMHPQADDPSSSSVMQDNNVDTDAQKFASLQTLSTGRVDLLGGTGSPFVGKEMEKKKDKEKKRKREDHKGRHNDAEYLERKRLKKEKRKREKEMAKLVGDGSKASPVKLPSNREEPSIKLAPVQPKPSEPSSSKGMAANVPTPKPEKSEGSSAPRFKIKIRNRTPNKL